MSAFTTRLVHTTAPTPGAVAILQLQGPGTGDLLRDFTEQEGFATGRMRLVRFADIDEGLAVLWREDWAQLMPHGGLRVVQRLTEALIQRGATLDEQPDPRQVYPEASDDIEAAMLHAMARAASPAAIERLAAQPAIWRQIDLPSLSAGRRAELSDIADRLDRLITPPTVVLMGRPNVGKSTLTNRLLRRSASVVADLPGTTRDWVAALAELMPPASERDSDDPLRSAIAIRWIDTPGLRLSDDPIEQSAIELAAQVIRSADLLLAIRDPTTDWPPAPSRQPDLFILNKIDTVHDAADQPRSGIGHLPDAPLPISATVGTSIQELEHAILRALGLLNLPTDIPWAFCPALREALSGD